MVQAKYLSDPVDRFPSQQDFLNDGHRRKKSDILAPIYPNINNITTAY